ncbi:hybrid sensor histidine kinase/response regulator [Haloferax massiliensis]|uniref:histidine kinase n=1 Tax=Haloferax massiliensis TaxID=1476858 RepID=A0A0D6JVJ6_9EURY|nr:PAS domain S-box protein [Haloferax massiliensis]CQR52485.1 Sporulation kinase E [Haloferax massiliensis]
MIGPATLLCVDQPEWTETVARQISNEDDRFEVICEQSASEALGLVKRKDIDCIVSAYDLPERTGLEFLRCVRESHPDLPFIIFTEEGSEQIASEAISAGVSDYFIKNQIDSQYLILANRLRDLVESHRTEQIVGSVESGWREAKERVNDIYYMFTSNWSELLYINSSYEVIWGGSIEELREKPQSFLDYIHPDDREIAVESMQKLSGGEPTDIEYRVQPPNGGIRWVRGVSEPIFNANGDVIRVMGAVRDISRLKERERRFQAVFEDSFDAMVIADDEGTYISVNDAACELFGLEEEVLLGRNVAEFAAPDFDVEEAWDEFQSIDHKTGLFPLQRPDGAIRLVEYEATTDIVPGEHLSILRDVTEREQQRRELAESEARYETLIEDVLDTSSVGTFILDEEFNVVWINHAIEESFGVDREDILGKDQASLIEDQLMQKFAQPEQFAERVLHTYTDNTDTEQFECKIRDETTDGWRWLRHWSHPIRGGLYRGGRIEHYTDITEIKTRDRQLQVLERIFRHNLQNKMNVILGFAETIASNAPEETSQQAAGIAQAGRDLLELSAKEKRIVELVRENHEQQPIEIAERVQDIVEGLQTKFSGAEITTQIRSEAQVLAVADIDRAVAEVIENAVMHSRDSTQVVVSIHSTSEETTITVRDNNPFIPELEKSVLRGGVEIDQLSHSRGLGLWLAYWLISESNGTISFESVEQGNEVQITLPRPGTREGGRY